MTESWQPFREPLRTTLVRTLTIAIVLGALLARWWGGGLVRWPVSTVLALWPSLGGHLLEIGFLNGIRPRIPRARAVQVVARAAVWFAGGVVLAFGMNLTANTLAGSQPLQQVSWWLGGLAMIAVELVAHLALQFHGQPSFYNGRG